MKCERMDKYDYLIALSTLDAKDDDVKMFMELDDSDVVLSDHITDKIEKLIRRESAYKTTGFVQFKRILSKVAIITLVVISIMFTAMMSVSAIRSAIWEIITEWYEEYIAVGYVPEEGFEVVEPPSMIEEIRKPTLLPLGAEEEVGINLKSAFTCDYYIGDRCYVSFSQSLLTSDVGMLDGDDATMTEIMVGEYKAWLFTYEKEGYIYILWNDTKYSYQISSTVLSVNELALIAESIK
ncbi:MAG: DUF4367 domain-containing protein [Clostridia bacterium]|nr:DUF4367 domain-containing protein [Clostridia bacterium]